MISLVVATANGPLAVMRSASSIAPASASPGSVTALTKPHSAPCSAVKLSPVSASSSAFWYGIRLAAAAARRRQPPGRA